MEELESRREQRSTTPGMEDDCREAGARATPGAVAEVDRVGVLVDFLVERLGDNPNWDTFLAQQGQA